MVTRSHYHLDKALKLSIFFMIMLLSIYSVCEGQSVQRITHVAIEKSVGLYGFAVQHQSIQDPKLRVLSRGVVAGVVVGNNLLRTRFRVAGLYNSTSFVQRKFDITQSEVLMNFYPLEFIRTQKNVLDIYVTSGINLNHFKFGKRDPSLPLHDTNPNSFGNVKSFTTLSQVIGLGSEYNLPGQRRKYIKFFTEVLLTSAFYSSADNPTVNGTSLKTLGSLNFGLRVGAIRKRAPQIKSFAPHH